MSDPTQPNPNPQATQPTPPTKKEPRLGVCKGFRMEPGGAWTATLIPLAGGEPVVKTGTTACPYRTGQTYDVDASPGRLLAQQADAAK